MKSITKRSWWRWVAGMRLLPYYGKHTPMVTSADHFVFDSTPQNYGGWHNPDDGVFGYRAEALKDNPSLEPDLTHPLTKGALVGILREVTGDPFACVHLQRGRTEQGFPEWKWICEWATGREEMLVDFTAPASFNYEALVLIKALDKLYS